MKKYIFWCSVISLTFLAGCKGKDSICSCIDATTKLNKKVTHVLHKTPTAADETALKALRSNKKKHCAEFEHMAGPEMMERKESCEK